MSARSTPPAYRLLLSPTSLDSLERVARSHWNSVSLSEPVLWYGPLACRTDTVRIHGAVEANIGVSFADAIPKMEMLGLSVKPREDAALAGGFVRNHKYLGSGDLFQAFLGRDHQILVAGRKHPVPDWAKARVNDIVVEDLIVMRHTSGQQLFIAPDEDLLGALAIVREEDSIPNSEATICYVRAL